jgi:hypothetical protein
MRSVAVRKRQVPPVFVIVGALAIAVIALSSWFLAKPSSSSAPLGPSPEAKAYLPNLKLSGVALKAAENLMRQQVVYIDGQITNNGPRAIREIDVYCIFTDPNGSEVYRERVPVVKATGNTPFGSNQVRSFELPFDNLPDTWNQGLPHLVIARINFAQQ